MTGPGTFPISKVSGILLFPLAEVAERVKGKLPGSWFCVPEMVTVDEAPGVMGFGLMFATRPLARPVTLSVIAWV
jgi:hypothetical protein